AERREPRQADDGGDDEGDQTVAELDRAVDAEGRMADEGVLRAPRPSGAAQPRAGQAYRPAGDDDGDVDHDGRDGEVAHAGEGWSGQLHEYEGKNPRFVAGGRPVDGGEGSRRRWATFAWAHRWGSSGGGAPCVARPGQA